MGQEPVTKHIPALREKNLLLFCKIDIVLSQLLMIYHYTHGCISQLASEGFLYVADSDKERLTIGPGAENEILRNIQPYMVHLYPLLPGLMDHCGGRAEL